MSPINGKGEGDSHEHDSVPRTLSRRGPDLAIQLAVLRDHSGERRCGVAGTAVSTGPGPHGSFARLCTGTVLAGLFTTGVALCLRPLSALRSELGLLGAVEDATALD